LTEKEIIEGCTNGNASCQRLLFEQYAGKFMSVCLRYANDAMEAEDMLQEAFIRIFSNVQKFKFEGSFEGWMRRIVVNVALKHLQKKKIRFNDMTEKNMHAQATLSEQAYSHLGEIELMKLISGLPKGYRIIFNLNVIEGYSHEEIAKMLKIKASTSRSQLVKARKMLQQQILQLRKIAVE